MAELERAARVHARMLANQPDLTPPQGGPVHPLEDLPAAARWVDVEGQGELRLQGVLRRARHVLRRRLLRLQAGASAARRRAAPCEATPPPPRPQRWRSRPSTSSRTPRAATPSASSSSTARPATRRRSSASSTSTSASSARPTRPRTPGCASGRVRTSSRPLPTPPSPAQPRRRHGREGQARHHVHRLRGPRPRPPRRFRAAGFAPQPPKRSRFPPAAGRRRRAGELHGRPGPGGQGRAVHMPVVGAAALRANWALAFRRADVRLAIVSRACRERVAKVVAPNPRTGEARARRAQIAVRMHQAW